MTRRTLTLLIASALVAGCTSSAGTKSIAQENVNPLMAEYYGEELADTLADLIIQNDPSVKDAAAKEAVQREISKAKAIARVGKEDRARGRYGAFISINEDADGQALFVDKRLYFSPTFMTEPGPSLHVILTTAVDPREGTFPDKTALDLGEVQSVLGAQTYTIDSRDENAALYRTVALWDKNLKRLYSFAQLSER